jgi:hypothetical protein
MADKKDPPIWVMVEAAKRIEWSKSFTLEKARNRYKTVPCFRELCDMIARHEIFLSDRKYSCAAEAFGDDDLAGQAKCVLAIELWQEWLEDELGSMERRDGY